MTDPLAAKTDQTELSPEDAAREVTAAYDCISQEVHKVIVGQDQVLDEFLMVLFCGGHALVVGVPGLAKTLLISTLARTLSLGFSRVQFTPDLMPSDEINRTPPKTQAALLEAMQERQVTAGGVRHPLPHPFFVLATQNPIEQEGTYPLPEAQLDRFMFNIFIDYPNEDQELQIVQQTTALREPDLTPVMSGDDVLRAQRLVRQVPAADHVVRYALKIARATRVGEEEDSAPELVRKYVSWGAGPRASQYLILAAKAKAILSGSAHVMPEHVQAVALPVMRHRIITNFNAEADAVTADDIVRSLLESISPDGTDAGTARRMDSVMK